MINRFLQKQPEFSTRVSRLETWGEARTRGINRNHIINWMVDRKWGVDPGCQLKGWPEVRRISKISTEELTGSETWIQIIKTWSEKEDDEGVWEWVEYTPSLDGISTEGR